jgi:2-dehydropantoate 2-reductase
MSLPFYKIAVVGAGGVGGYFGGKLALAGKDVTFIARGEHLKALQNNGLRVISVKGDFHLPVKATDNPAQVGPVEVVLFCVKSYSTEEAARQCLPLMGPETVVISLQNGVDNEEKLAAILGREKILGGVAYIGAGIKEPGVILHTLPGKFAFGELPGGISPRVKELEQFFQAAGVEAKANENIQKALWDKLMWNAAFNGISAATGATLDEIGEEPLGKEWVRKVMEEVRAVAAASGIELVVERMEYFVESSIKSKGVKTSTLQDLEAGKPLEAEALNGMVVKKGQELGVPTPYNFGLYAALSMIDKVTRKISLEFRKN